MTEPKIPYPSAYEAIYKATQAAGFNQSSDASVGLLLKTLCASKLKAKFLELGTGSGLSTSWILAGMCEESTLVTVDSDDSLVEIAKEHLGFDARVQFVVGKGEDLIDSVEKSSIDFIFADTWPGKYHHLDETLELLRTGGIYIVDDMLPQENWPDGHQEKASALMGYLSNRDDLHCARLDWATGIILCTKK